MPSNSQAACWLVAIFTLLFSADACFALPPTAKETQAHCKPESFSSFAKRITELPQPVPLKAYAAARVKRVTGLFEVESQNKKVQLDNSFLIERNDLEGHFTFRPIESSQFAFEREFWKMKIEQKPDGLFTIISQTHGEMVRTVFYDFRRVNHCYLLVGLESDRLHSLHIDSEAERKLFSDPEAGSNAFQFLAEQFRSGALSPDSFGNLSAQYWTTKNRGTVADDDWTSINISEIKGFEKTIPFPFTTPMNKKIWALETNRRSAQTASIDVYKVANPHQRVQYLYRSYEGAMRLEKIIDVYALLDQRLAMGFR
jgi:hypothetical protein